MQAGLNYQHVVWPRVRHVLTLDDARTVSAFRALCERDGTANVVGRTHPGKLERIEALTAFLERQGIETEDDLRAWLADPGRAEAHTAELLELPGIGPKTVDYLRILSGDDSVVAPDVHQLRFLQLAGIEARGYDEARAAVIEAARLLGVSPALLDHAIWEYMSGSGAGW